jgi:hypothetical protein
VRRIPILAAVFLGGLTAAARSDNNVQLSGGRLSVYAKNVTLVELLDQIRSQTGMRVIYDGAPPQQRVGLLSLENQTPVAAVIAVLEGRGIKYAMVVDGSGTQVATLLITTAAVAGRPDPPADPSHVAIDPDPLPPEFDVPVADYEPQYEPPPAPTPYNPTPAPSSPFAVGASVPPPASPFTPQGPGPVLLPAPGAASATPAPSSTPPPAMTPLPGPSTAELPPWERGAYTPPSQ